MEATKRCPDCQEEKLLSRYGKYNPWYCKDCLNRRQREFQQKKRAEVLAARASEPESPKVKVCGICKESKPFSEFNFNNRERGWLQPYCRPCALQYGRDRKTARGWESVLIKSSCKRFGTTPEWYHQKLAEQKEVCAICGQKEDHPAIRGGQRIRKLAIDHNHTTGKVRGLLCCKCNQSLHRLEKFPGWAEAAVAYLAKYKET